MNDEKAGSPAASVLDFLAPPNDGEAVSPAASVLDFLAPPNDGSAPGYSALGFLLEASGVLFAFRSPKIDGSNVGSPSSS